MDKNRSMGDPAIPGISVKIYLPKGPEKLYGKLLGFASVNLGGVFAVNNIRIYDSDKGPFVSMPSSKGRDGKYYDICCPTTKEMREAVHGAILGAYQREVERPSLRGAIKDAAREAAPGPAIRQRTKRPADRGVR